MSKRRVVFLDRDGTLNRDIGYPACIEQIHLYPGAVEAVRRINAAGRAAVVVTHQTGVGRGYFSEEDLQSLHRQFETAMTDGGARVDGIYYCPHDPDSPDVRYRVDCLCRKPRPGLIHQAALELGLDLEGAAVVGDKADDVRLGQAFGARSVLVLTGYGKEARRLLEVSSAPADFVAPGVLEAVDWILAELEGS